MLVPVGKPEIRNGYVLWFTITHRTGRPRCVRRERTGQARRDERNGERTGTGYGGGTSHNGEGKQRPAQGAALALRTTANGRVLTIVRMYNVISAAARALAVQLTRR